MHQWNIWQCVQQEVGLPGCWCGLQTAGLLQHRYGLTLPSGDTTYSDTGFLFSGAQVDVFFGAGMGPIYLSDVQCTGMETSILNCSHGNQVGITTCDHTQDAAIRCEGRSEAVRGERAKGLCYLVVI